MATFDMNWDAQAIAPFVIHPLAGSGRASPVEVVDLSADDSESADSDSVTSDYVDSCLGDEGYEPFGMLGACDFRFCSTFIGSRLKNIERQYDFEFHTR